LCGGDDSIKNALEGITRILNDSSMTGSVTLKNNEEYFLLTKVQKQDLKTFVRDIKNRFANPSNITIQD
jgi:hypothetical protein